MASLASAGTLQSTSRMPSQHPSNPNSPQVGTTTDNSNDSTVLARRDPALAVKKLEIKLKAVNTNNVARVANSHLTNEAERLVPLVSVKTGRPLEKFPERPKDVLKLSVTTMDMLLNHLDAERGGNERQKRERLRLHLGLKPIPG